MVYQIVDESGHPVNDYIYNDLEVANEKCNNLMENYYEYYAVRILQLYPQK